MEWDNINKLVCNPSKTEVSEVIQFSSHSSRAQFWLILLSATLEYNHQTEFVIFV